MIQCLLQSMFPRTEVVTAGLPLGLLCNSADVTVTRSRGTCNGIRIHNPKSQGWLINLLSTNSH